MRTRDFLKRLDAARERVSRETTGNARRGSMFARGLANEGYAGGYAAALRDLDSVLRDLPPADSRGQRRN